jgi:DNA-binding transcriptional LysR family regulator
MPNEPELVAQLAGKMRFGLYTVPAYEAFFGMPKTLEKLFPHRIIDHSTLGASQLQPWHGIVSNHPHVAYRTNPSVCHQWAIQAGYGIGLFPNYTTKIFPSLIPVPVELGIEAPIWLVSHEETNKIACTRIALDYIRDRFFQGSCGMVFLIR